MSLETFFFLFFSFLNARKKTKRKKFLFQNFENIEKYKTFQNEKWCRFKQDQKGLLHF
jgi:hypothetical protein